MSTIGITREGIKINIDSDKKINANISKNKIEVGGLSYKPKLSETHTIIIEFKGE